MILLKGTTTIKHNLSPSQEFLNSPVKSESKKYHHKTDSKITRLSQNLLTFFERVQIFLEA